MTDVAPRMTTERPANDGIMSGVKAPTKTRAKNPRMATTGRKRSLEKDLNSTLTNLGKAVFVIQPVDGSAIIEGAEPLAKALNDVAKENDAVYRFLVAANQSSKWGALILAVAGIAVPILANHNLLPVAIPDSFMPNPIKVAEEIGIPLKAPKEGAIYGE